MADAAEQPVDDIQVECTETSPVLRSLRVEVDADRVRRAFDRAYADLRRSARVKGFRPGKVPRSVLERMYGASLPEEIERVLVGETLSAAIEQAGIEPISEPDIDAEPPAPDTAFRYTARVEVKPSITLPDPGSVTGRKPIVAVPAEEIDAELARIRERHESLVEEPEGTQAADGHVVTVDFEGRVDGEPFRGGTAKAVDIRLGTGSMVPGFEEQLVGVRAGEDIQVTITFPDDYGNDELAGKEAVFDCHVVAVRRRELPALDDELAKDVGEFESLDALRAKIEGDKRKQRESAAQRTLNESLLDSLIELTDFEVPPGVVDRQLTSQMRSMHDQFHGRVPHEILDQQLRRMQEEGRPMAERRVREAFLLEAIAETNAIEVGDEDVDARLAEMAGEQGMDADELRQIAERQGWLHAIEHELREQKAYAWVAERAKIEEFDSEAEDASDEDAAGEEDAPETSS